MEMIKPLNKWTKAEECKYPHKGWQEYKLYKSYRVVALFPDGKMREIIRVDFRTANKKWWTRLHCYVWMFATEYQYRSGYAYADIGGYEVLSSALENAFHKMGIPCKGLAGTGRIREVLEDIAFAANFSKIFISEIV